jgi:hypothetical protein
MGTVGARAQGAHHARRDRGLNTPRRLRPGQQCEGHLIAGGNARRCHQRDPDSAITVTDHGSAIAADGPNDGPAARARHQCGGAAATSAADCRTSAAGPEGQLLPDQ